MATATISQQELQQNYAAAEEATHSGPVFITKDGQTRSVLIDIADYRRLAKEPEPNLTSQDQSLATLLAVPEDEYFEWEPEPLGELFRPADFS